MLGGGGGGGEGGVCHQHMHITQYTPPAQSVCGGWGVGWGGGQCHDFSCFR